MMVARIRHFLLYAALGAVGTLVQYAVLVALVQGTGAQPVLASTLGFLIGGVVNYTLARTIAFRSSRPHHEAATKFFLVAGVGLCLTALLMTGFIAGLGLPYLLAQVLTTGLVLFWHYAGNTLWTFRETKAA
jgi:putative flippase GtrA